MLCSCVISSNSLGALTTSDIVSLSPANTQLTENTSNIERINANTNRLSIFVFSPPFSIFIINHSKINIYYKFKFDLRTYKIN